MRILAKSTIETLFGRAGRVLLSKQEYQRLKSFQMTAERIREERRLTHVAIREAPAVALAMRPADDNPLRLRIADRLLVAYEMAAREEPLNPMRRNEADMWTELLGHELQDLITVVEARDVAGMSRYLMNFGSDYVWFGGLTFSIDGYSGRNWEEKSVALQYLDKLICLAEAVGVLPYENPEHGRWGENIYADTNVLLGGLESALGISLSPPAGIVPTTGIDTQKGVLHYRHINGIYVASRLRALVPPDSAICEYGGGNGIAAYYAWQMGFRNYTVFDLPLVNLIAGHYLLNALGEDAVTLYGEERRPEAIALLPYWKCLDYPQRAFYLALNQDSFPEIDAELVTRYLSAIAYTTERFFLSINHEAESPMAATRQLNVPSLLKMNEHYKRIHRFRYPVREGYVEELYDISGNAPPEGLSIGGRGG